MEVDGSVGGLCLEVRCYRAEAQTGFAISKGLRDFRDFECWN